MDPFFRIFEADRCTACGTCLDRCVYLPHRGAEAARAREAIREGRCPDDILARCVSCYACDAFCPNGLHPYEGILQFWDARYRSRGLPERARFLMPESRPNFRTHVIDRLPPEHRARVEAWASPARRPTGRVLYPGCNLITLPHLVDHPLLADVTVAGSLDDCCGEMYFRMGLFDEVDRIAARLTERYAGSGIEEMLFVCPACYNMFTHILPERFGARFDFSTRFVPDLLVERLDAGTAVPAPLSGRVAVHDSCHARGVGAELLDAPRALLARLGLSPVEIVQDLSEGFCCGIAAGCSRQSPLDIVRTAWMALEAARRTGADRLATYCGGCLLTLTMVQRFYPLAPRPVHVLELAAEAWGRPLSGETGRNAANALSGIVRRSLPSILSGGRFRVS